MLTEEDFFDWYQSIHLEKKTIDFIEEIRSTPPSRRVQSHKNNVSGRYPSRKMGAVIQFESHKNELAAILEYEYNNNIIEYYDQPHPPIKLKYKTRNGKNITVLHIPDFFVIKKASAGWVECKTEEELNNLSEKQPNRYLRREDGLWICPPGEQYAAELGLNYEIRSSAQNNPIYLRNIEFLEDYLRADKLSISQEIRFQLFSIIKAIPGITLDELLQKFHLVNKDIIYQLVAINELFINLTEVSLTEPKKVKLFVDQQNTNLFNPNSNPISKSENKIEVGQAIFWDGIEWTIANLGTTQVTLIKNDNLFTLLPLGIFNSLMKEKAITLNNQAQSSVAKNRNEDVVKRASLKDFEKAAYKYEVISAYIKDKRLNTSKENKRTILRWLAAYRVAEREFGNGYIGLFSKRWSQGNRKVRLSNDIRALISSFIDEKYETFTQRPMYEVYADLLRECQLKGRTAPSYKTFTKQVKLRPRYEQSLNRMGHRAAYKDEPFYYDLNLGTPRHGDFPFHITHLDHTELDIELVCSTTGKQLGRPWLSLMTDAFSRRILAIFITYDPPSYRSCMMVLRECVRKYGRFPQTLVVDGGREFDSVYFETLLARYECTKKTRPQAKPRFGSVIERLFGATNTRLIYNLAGNTQIMKNVRQTTKTNNPKNQAVWTLEALYKCLYEWAYEIYDTIEHPTLGQSPRDAFMAGLINSGYREHRQIPYDSEFLIWTLPTTTKGTARVIPGKGVKINYFYYWNNVFRNPEIEQKQVQIRYDPYDISIAYAYVHNHWVNCISEYYTSLRGHSQRELMILSAELHKSKQNHSKKFIFTAKKIADFLSTTQTDESLLLQQLKDKEAKSIIRVIDNELLKKYPPTINNVSSAQDKNDKLEENAEDIDITKFEIYEEF